jgi:thiol-disulfide isomerase/thioredoxin
VKRAAVLVLVACNSQSAPPVGGRVEIIAAPPTGELTTYIAGEVTRGTRDQVPVLVYVGATWCEPCRDFHAAATAGSLDAALGPLRLVEFDLDRDESQLAAAGYTSKLVPLFARPAADGKATGKQIEGVKKGTDYVGQLTPRVRSLLDTP